MKTLITRFALGVALVLCGAKISHAKQETSSSIILPPGFTAEPFYVGVPNPDGIAVRSDGSLLVVNESEPQGVFVATKGDMFDIGDAFSTTGTPFVSPDDILLHPDGTVFVVDGQAHAVFKIPAGGGTPTAFVTPETIDIFCCPFGITSAPDGFMGPNVSPGDLIVADNGSRKIQDRAVWAIHPITGAARVIAKGRAFFDGPIQVGFTPDKRLFVYQNYGSGSSRLIDLGADGTLTPILSCVPDRGGIAINPVTGDVYLGLQERAREIWRISSDGGAPRVFASNFPGRFQDMTFSADGRALFVSAPNDVIEIRGPFFDPIREAKPLASIAGTVTRPSDGSPWAGVPIRVEHQEGEIRGEVTTGAAGRYQVWSVPGPYRVSVMNAKETPPVEVILDAGKQVDGIDFAPDLATIAGQVTLQPDSPFWRRLLRLTPGGSPWADVTIRIEDEGGTAWYRAITGADGHYRVWVEPGIYQVSAVGAQGVDPVEVSLTAGAQAEDVDFAGRPIQPPKELTRAAAVYQALQGYQDTTTVGYAWSGPVWTTG